MPHPPLRAAIAAAAFLALGPHALRAADLTSWPAESDPRTLGARVAARFLSTPHMLSPLSQTIHYAEVCICYGALGLARATEDRGLARQLETRFQPFYGTSEVHVPAVDHVDHSVFGAVPLELYLHFGHARHRTLGLAFADGQWDRARPDGLTPQTRFWIDDMYMITVLQAQAYRATGAPHYLDRTAREMVAYLDRLQRPNGLFFHEPDTPFFWGRGNGWMAAGMTELLRDLPVDHTNRARIEQGYRAMMAALLRYQSADACGSNSSTNPTPGRRVPARRCSPSPSWQA